MIKVRSQNLYFCKTNFVHFFCIQYDFILRTWTLPCRFSPKTYQTKRLLFYPFLIRFSLNLKLKRWWPVFGTIDSVCSQKLKFKRSKFRLGTPDAFKLKSETRNDTSSCQKFRRTGLAKKGGMDTKTNSDPILYQHNPEILFGKFFSVHFLLFTVIPIMWFKNSSNLFGHFYRSRKIFLRNFFIETVISKA